ncbi:MAG: NYN domain-containing protein [Candidatus Thorarchaeota archaeon]
MSDIEETAEERKLYERISDRILSSSHLQALRGRLTGEKKLAVLVDGPNFLRKTKDKQIKLEDIDDNIQDFGKATIKKVILNEFASQKLIQAITNSGYEPIVSTHDTHITLVIEAMNLIQKEKHIDMVVIASRHARVNPILIKLKEKGIETAVVGFEPGFSVALKKSADYTILIE